jgi:hypothetical protein
MLTVRYILIFPVLLAQYNVPVPRGEVAFTVEEAETAAKNIGGSGWTR